MANTYNEHNGTGSQDTFAYTFPYLKTTDVKVSVDGVVKQLTTDYTRPSVTTIQFNSDKKPANGTKVRIYRDTDESSANATFYAGSAIKSQDLNDNFLQAIYIGEEGKEAGDDSWNKLEDSVDSTETWVSNNTTISTTGAIDARVDSKIDTALTTDVAAGNRITVTDNSPGSGQITVALTSGSLVDSDINASAAIAGSKLQASSGSNAGSMSAANFSKLGGIETGATADQTAAEIRTLVEAASDSNVFTTADHTKLDGIETAATGDQTNAEIRAAVEAATDSNVFTDADHTKLNSIEASATGDQTNAEIRAAVEAASDSNVFTDADHSKLNAIEASATADQTASEIKTLLQSDKLTSSEIATGALDGRYYTETESDARYFNVSTGDTIKDGDAFPDNDTTIATTAAINDRIIDLVDDVGGFVPIANETSFPNANPDVNNGTGTLISIKTLSSNLTSNGSGVATIANGTVGNSTVTITGLANSTTYSSGYGMIVETTTTLNTYTFHRQVPLATEITSVAAKVTEIGRLGTAAAVEDLSILGTNAVVADLAILGTTDVVADMNTLGTTDVVSDMNTLAVTSVINNMDTCATNVSNINNVGGSIANVNTVASNLSTVNDFGARYRVASSDPTSNNDEGDLVFNTTSNELRVYNGSSWQGGVTATGNLAGLGANTFTGSQSLGDNNKVQLGAGNDLQIYHDGSTNIINGVNGNTSFRTAAADALGENAILIVPNGSVSLYYDDSQKFLTKSWGAYIEGGLKLNTDSEKLYIGTGDDLQIYHDGSHSNVQNSTGNLHLRSNANCYIQLGDGSGGFENAIRSYPGGAVELYYDNAVRFKTRSNGNELRGSVQYVEGLLRPWDATGTDLGTDADRFQDLYLHNDLDLKDDGKLLLGNSDDLQIYHDGSDSYIKDTGTGQLLLQTNELRVHNAAGNELQIATNENGDVQLYYDGTLRFYTTSTGSQVNGDLRFDDNHIAKWGNSQDLQIYHDGGDSVINNNAGNLYINAKTGETGIRINRDGSVELYYDNSKKLATASDKINFYAHAKVNADNTYDLGASGARWKDLYISNDIDIIDNGKILLGTGDDLQIFHDGSDSYIDETGTGDLKIRSSSGIQLQNSSEKYLACIPNGATELYWDGANRFSTTSYGVSIIGDALWGDGRKAVFGNDGLDLQIYHDGSHNRIRHNVANQNLYIEGVDNEAGTPFIYLNPRRNQTGLSVKANQGVDLYYDNSKKLETTSSGINVVGSITQNGAALGGGVWERFGAVTITSNSSDVDLTWASNSSIMTDYEKIKFEFYNIKKTSDSKTYIKFFDTSGNIMTSSYHLHKYYTVEHNQSNSFEEHNKNNEDYIKINEDAEGENMSGSLEFYDPFDNISGDGPIMYFWRIWNTRMANATDSNDKAYFNQGAGMIANNAAWDTKFCGIRLTSGTYTGGKIVAYGLKNS